MSTKKRTKELYEKISLDLKNLYDNIVNDVLWWLDRLLLTKVYEEGNRNKPKCYVASEWTEREVLDISSQLLFKVWLAQKQWK